MAQVKWSSIVSDGLWKKNQAVVALLGLCPLLAVSNSVVSALGLGLATLVVLCGSNTIISACRNWIPKETRIPIFVGIIASLVSIVEMLINAWWHDLYLKLGIFIPLIVTNCIILARADGFASKNSVGAASLDGFSMGVGFLIVLVLMGGVREVLGQGTLLQSAEQLFGASAADWVIHVADFRLTVAILPAGAFMILAFFVAAVQYVQLSKSKTSSSVIIKRADVEVEQL